MTILDTPLDRDQLAAVVARDIPHGSFVNLGIGLPTKVSNHPAPDDGVFLRTCDARRPPRHLRPRLVSRVCLRCCRARRPA